MSRRKDEMLAAVDAFAKVHADWVADPNRRDPDATFWDGFDELANAFDPNLGVPGECHELASAVKALLVEEDAFSNRENTSTDMPHQAFWKAWEAVAAARKPKTAPPRRPMESVKQLNDEKVPHDQIARMYGLFGPNGQPASWLIQKELDEPGSVITPEVLAKLENQQAETDDADHEQTESEQSQSLERKRRRAKDDELKPCPETAEELWMQKVSIPQSAKMLIKSEAEVAALFDGFEKDRQRRKADLAAQAAVKAVQGQQDQATDSSSAEGVDAQIASMIDQGFTKEQIVETLKVDGRTVAAAFRRKQPQTATA